MYRDHYKGLDVLSLPTKNLEQEVTLWPVYPLLAQIICASLNDNRDISSAKETRRDCSGLRIRSCRMCRFCLGSSRVGRWLSNPLQGIGMVRVAGLMGWKEERGAECTGVINE